MLEAIKRLLARKETQAGPPVAYSIERDARVTSALGSEGLKFSRHLEAAQRIDPNKFCEAIDALIHSAPYEDQREYGEYHRKRFFELFNLSAELVADVGSPLIIDFGASEFTHLYKRLFTALRLHVADYPNPYFTASYVIENFGADRHYELDLTRRTSREAALIPRGSFDLVIFSEVLEHLLANPVEIIAWLLSLVKPGGHLLLTTPNMFAKHNMPVFLTYDNPLPPFPKEENRASLSAHLREYSHIELLRFVKAAGGDTKALIFSSCWDDDETLAPVERRNIVLVATPRIV